jgi:hypothetical protein
MTDTPFRLTMRSDHARRKILCVLLLVGSAAMVVHGLRGGTPQWGWLLLASLVALPGIALVKGLVSPVLYELVLDRESLRWGPVNGAQLQVARRDVASMYFGDESGAADLVGGDRKQLPMDIINGRMRKLSEATARLWPGTKILTRFETDVSMSLP